MAISNCSFCGKSQTEVSKLISGPQVYICNECIDLCNEILTEENKKEAFTENKKLKVSTPAEIKSSLDEYIIGQDQAKKSMAVAVHSTLR